MFPTAVTTFESFTTPIRFAFNGVDMVASGTGLRSISWWHKHYRNPSNSGFIQNIFFQLVESPIVSFTLFFFTARFAVQRLSDIGQILKHQCCTEFFSFLYKLFTNVVVNPRLKPTFSTREPPKQSFTAFGAFALNVSSDSTIPVSKFVQLFTTPSLTCRCSSNRTSTKVNPYRPWVFFQFAEWEC